MSKIIEIIDSEEETTEQPLSTQASTSSAVVRNNKPEMTATIEVKKSRRKSVLQNLQDADVHFETIYVEDEEAEINNLKTPETSAAVTKLKHVKVSESSMPRKQRFRRNKYMKKPEELENMFNEFMSSEETVSLIHKIAEERVRINFLLATLNVPVLDLQPMELNITELNKQIDESLKDKHR